MNLFGVLSTLFLLLAVGSARYGDERGAYIYLGAGTALAVLAVLGHTTEIL